MKGAENMHIDFDKITYNEMLKIGEFFNLHVDGDKKAVVIEGVKQ